jgi:hypothetical protein
MRCGCRGDNEPSPAARAAQSQHDDLHDHVKPFVSVCLVFASADDAAVVAGTDAVDDELPEDAGLLVLESLADA